MLRKRICFTLVLVALVIVSTSAQAALPSFTPLTDYAIRLYGPPSGFTLVEPTANWPHTWNPTTNTLWVLNGYMGEDWHKEFSLELWTSGGSFNPSTTTVPTDLWIGITPIFDNTTPPLIHTGFLVVEWEPYGNGWHYGFRGGICPQPDSESFLFATLVAGGGQIEAIDLRTTCVPGACVPEPSSLLTLAGCLIGLTGIVRKKR